MGQRLAHFPLSHSCCDYFLLYLAILAFIPTPPRLAPRTWCWHLWCDGTSSTLGGGKFSRTCRMSCRGKESYTYRFCLFPPVSLVSWHLDPPGSAPKAPVKSFPLFLHLPIGYCPVVSHAKMFGADRAICSVLSHARMPACQRVTYQGGGSRWGERGPALALAWCCQLAN